MMIRFEIQQTACKQRARVRWRRDMQLQPFCNAVQALAHARSMSDASCAACIIMLRATAGQVPQHRMGAAAAYREDGTC